MSDEQSNIILNMFKEDQNIIIYRPKMSRILGTTSAILLSQILYWYAKANKPFYKYRSPCQASKPGDSWCEEIGFTTGEFDTALKRIGTKIKKGDNKERVLSHATSVPMYIDSGFPETREEHVKRIRNHFKALVIYWTDSNRKTWYMVNEKLLANLGNHIYIGNFDFHNYLTTDSAFTLYTKTTTETTTDKTTLPPQPQDGDDASDFGTVWCRQCNFEVEHGNNRIGGTYKKRDMVQRHSTHMCNQCHDEYGDAPDLDDSHDVVWNTNPPHENTLDDYISSEHTCANGCTDCKCGEQQLTAEQANALSELPCSHYRDTYMPLADLGYCEYIATCYDEDDEWGITAAGRSALEAYKAAQEDECPPMADLMRACMPTVPDADKRIEGRDGSGWQAAQATLTPAELDDVILGTRDNPIKRDDVTAALCEVVQPMPLGATVTIMGGATGRIVKAYKNHADVEFDNGYTAKYELSKLTLCVPEQPPTLSAKKPRKRSAKQLANDAIVDAIVDAFGHDPDTLTKVSWSLARKVAKELLLLPKPATPEQVVIVHDYCKAKFDNFGYGAISSNYAASMAHTTHDDDDGIPYIESPRYADPPQRDETEEPIPNLSLEELEALEEKVRKHLTGQWDE